VMYRSESLWAGASERKVLVGLTYKEGDFLPGDNVKGGTKLGVNNLIIRRVRVTLE